MKHSEPFRLEDSLKGYKSLKYEDEQLVLFSRFASHAFHCCRLLSKQLGKVDDKLSMKLLERKEEGEAVLRSCQMRRSVVVQLKKVCLFIVAVLALLGLRGEWHIAITISSDLSNRDIAKAPIQDAHAGVVDQDEFQPQNLLPSDRVPCGANKCLFQLKSDPRVAYLVAPSKRLSKKQSEAEWFKTLMVSWRLAKELEVEHGIKQFLLDVPRNITITPELAARMNQHLWVESRGKMMTSERFPVGSTAYIQKVEVAPSPNIIIGCAKSKMKQFERAFEQFIPAVKRKKHFARKFTKYLKRSRELLQKEDCLYKDFQVLLDVHGHLYHLDLDRCFNPEDPGAKRTVAEEDKDACLETLDEV